MKIREGERYPFGYGYAWTNFESDTIEVYLIPLNLVQRWLRKVWFFLGRKQKDGYDKAYREGVKVGRASAVVSRVREEMEDKIKVLLDRKLKIRR